MLRPVEPEDLPLLYQIENDPAMWDVSATPHFYSHYMLRSYVQQQHADLVADGQLRLVITSPEAAPEAAPAPGIGLIDLQNFSPADGRAEVGIALLRACRGRGWASRALLELETLARRHWRLRLLYALIPEGNALSHLLFEHAHYRRIALLPRWLLRAGEPFNVEVMAKEIDVSSNISHH